MPQRQTTKRISPPERVDMVQRIFHPLVLTKDIFGVKRKIAASYRRGRLCSLKNLAEHKSICFLQMNKGKNNRFSRQAFTMMELLIVVVLISILAAFGIVSYQKMLYKAYERDIVVQLRAIQAASEIYRAQNGVYWSGTGGPAVFNPALGISVVPSSTSTVYTYSGNGVNFSANGEYSPGNIEIQIDSTVGPDPCCVTTGCLTVPAC
jgi:prepilin-type N-terminal cleavage/methylation domain-containing protein